MTFRAGKVYLVGAGPGDKGLITLKAVECLKLADVVVYDYLANKLFLDFSLSKSKKIYVGKKGSSHSKGQEEINRLLIREARLGKIVVRLKGGDPFIFGRGGEEAEALAKAKIPFEVVPGVTSAVAVPAYAGIPLTHRNFTSVVAFVTGHEQDKRGIHPPDWNSLSKIGTLVFLMGYGRLPEIAKKLIDAGRAPSTPVAVIQWGTLPKQRTAIGTLKTIVKEVQKMNLRPPTITVVGDVVSLREKISWFETLPLFGKRIVVTRARAQASVLSEKLSALGAQVIEVPVLEVAPPKSFRELDHEIKNIKKYSWIVFTSTNAVHFFYERLKVLKLDARQLAGVRCMAVGEVTASALRAGGIHADFVSKGGTALAMIQEWLRLKLKAKRILFPSAEDAQEEWITLLASKKIKVKRVVAYRKKKPQIDSKKLDEIFNPPVHLLTFASSSAAKNFFNLIPKKNRSLLSTIPVLCIGPTTLATARDLGFENFLPLPHSPTIDAMVQRLIEPSAS